jgi:GAF domain-containing protein
MSGSAVAARTASTRSPLLLNSFARVRHVSLFESVKIGSDAEEPGAQQLPIQKIMSVPIVGPNGQIVGVVQVSRKGLDPKLAGNDFTNDDLKLLEKAAEIFARLPFMQDSPE